MPISPSDAESRGHTTVGRMSLSLCQEFHQNKREKSGLKVSLDRETPRWEGSCLLFARLLYGLLKPVWLMFLKPLKFGRQLTRGYSFAGPLTLRAVARLRTISLHITDKPTMTNNGRGKNTNLWKALVMSCNPRWGFSWTLRNVLDDFICFYVDLNVDRVSNCCF